MSSIMQGHAPLRRASSFIIRASAYSYERHFAEPISADIRVGVLAVEAEDGSKSTESCSMREVFHYVYHYLRCCTVRAWAEKGIT